jgi:hypothetical protein
MHLKRALGVLACVAFERLIRLTRGENVARSDHPR